MRLVAAQLKPFTLDDGRVWTTAFDGFVRVRTGERGPDAL